MPSASWVSALCRLPRRKPILLLCRIQNVWFAAILLFVASGVSCTVHAFNQFMIPEIRKIQSRFLLPLQESQGETARRTQLGGPEVHLLYTLACSPQPLGGALSF